MISEILLGPAHPHRMRLYPQSVRAHPIRLLVQACLVVCAGLLRAQIPTSGDNGIHDPSTLIKEGNRYYTFGTGDGIRILSSTNLRTWTASRVFTAPPAWTTAAVTGFAGNFWAPDVAFFNGRYHVYYSCSNWGTIDSAIGLVTTPSLSNPVWTDHGKVVQSDAIWETTPQTDVTQYNCIDPSVLVDTDGRVWLAFGSYSDGIVVTEIDPATGLRNGGPITRIAHNGAAFFSNTTEAAHLYRRNGYYYLFLNDGGCCSGIDSTYRIRVGRSTSVTGPYLDRDGRDLDEGGGTVVLESTHRRIGPGHAGIFEEAGRFWLSHHYYDGLANGAPLLGINELTWDVDGWPVVLGDWGTRYTFDLDGRDQTGQHAATLVSGAAIVSDGDRGNVLALTGGSQHALLPLSVANARTFSAWVRWEGGAANQRLLDLGSGSSAYLQLTPSGSNGRLRLSVRNGGTEQRLDAPSALPSNRWCHVAVVLDGSRARLHVDGSQVAEGPLTISPWELRARELYIGRSRVVGEPPFLGRIDDLRIHARALGGAALARLAGVSRSGAANVAHWTFEDGIANAFVPFSASTPGTYDGSLRDQSGNGNHLSAWASNWAIHSPLAPAPDTPATGVANRLSLRNANAFPSLSAIGTRLTTWKPLRWTIEAAIRPDSTEGFQTFVGRDSQGSYAANPALAALYFSVRPGGVLALTFTDAAGQLWNLESAAGTILPRTWHAVAASSDGRTLRLHARNLDLTDAQWQLLGSLDLSASPNPALSTGAGNGADWDPGVFTVARGLFNGAHTDRFLGHIDDVRFSEEALEPEEFLHRTSATSAHWDFEEGAVDTYVPYAPATAGQFDGQILDRSGNARPLSAWTRNLHWYRSLVPASNTPQTGTPNTRSLQNASGGPSLSAVGTSLTTWRPRAWTLEAAIRPTGVTGFQTFIGRDSQGANLGNTSLSALYFSARPNGVLAIAYTDGAGNHWNLESAAGAITANQWHAVAATSDGSTLRLFRKTLASGSTTYTQLGELDISSSADPSISTGSGDGSTWDPGVFSVARGLFNSTQTDRFLGHVDDVRLSASALAETAFLHSNRPLSPDETWRLANFGNTTATGPSADLADPDGDGLSNVLERALGANPLISDATRAPRLGLGNGALRFEFPLALAATDLRSLVLEADTPAGPWRPALGTYTLESEDTGSRVLLLSRPLPEGAPIFLRLETTTR